MTEASLVCHRDTPAAWLEGIVVTVALDRQGGMSLVYTINGNLQRLRLPPPAPPERVDGLWRHTCCEAFLMGARSPAYREYNFAPSGAWQAYDFASYRHGGLPARIRAPQITRRLAETRLTLTATVSPADLPAGRRLRLALSAVIEDVTGQLSYWALAHPAEQADFHHPDAFTLELDLTP